MSSSADAAAAPATKANVESVSVQAAAPVERPEPLQIITTGSTNDDCFVLHEENLSRVLRKVPEDMKIAVIAVVGAFRSGKSFLLNFFLRYLRNGNVDDITQSWMLAEGESLIEGNQNEFVGEGEGESTRESSFAWRGGEERMTTGIWMWSEPFIRATKSSNGEKMAILLMDTQGMFDNETTMTLTAQIFGLSTLVSSFQIYNVDKKVQEDNLQHLALFSEYGRMALSTESETIPKDLEAVKSSISNSASATETTTADDSSKAEEKEQEQEPKKEQEKEKRAKKPFQRLQFLVRDWQNFDKDYNEEEDSEQWFAEFQAGMKKYIDNVLAERTKSDLQSTREQIARCFEKVDCFQLPHPGNPVTRKNFDGLIKKIDPSFRGLVNRYVRTIFDEELEPKEVNQRQITGRELKAYFEVYAKLFQAGSDSFPKAMTMLDATAEANNRNAYDMALSHFKKNMELAVGEDKPFVKEIELTPKADQFYTTSLKIFDEIATMGSPSVIEKCRHGLVDVLEAEKKRYFSTNALKNPFKDIEFFVIPLVIAIGAWFLAFFTDKVCSTDFCERVEDTFVNIYLFIFFAILALAWKQIGGSFRYMKELAPLVLDQINKKN